MMEWLLGEAVVSQTHFQTYREGPILRASHLVFALFCWNAHSLSHI